MYNFDVFELITHLRKCTDVFLTPTNFSKVYGLNSIALLCDTYRIVSNDFLQNDFKLPSNFQLAKIDDNHWGAIHISSWLLHHPSFKNVPTVATKLHYFWFEALLETSLYVKFKEWISDEERAEEMVRLLLNCCDILPAGESKEEAIDKLAALDSSERQVVLRQSYDALQRILDIKKKMAEKQAREAANTYGRE